ncbi:MAG: hypothetical protein AB1414_17170, partial [bacterium]
QKITQYGRGGKTKGESLPPMVFTYHPDNPNWDKYKWDRWGYYYEKGSEGTHNLESKLNGLKPWVWSLTKVTSPTGGFTEWAYESDVYCLEGETEKKYGGGIRVGTVTADDGLGNKSYTRYLYSTNDLDWNNSHSSGLVSVEPAPFSSSDPPFHTLTSPQEQSYVGYKKVTTIPGYNPNTPTEIPYGYVVNEFTGWQRKTLLSDLSMWKIEHDVAWYYIKAFNIKLDHKAKVKIACYGIQSDSNYAYQVDIRLDNKSVYFQYVGGGTYNDYWRRHSTEEIEVAPASHTIEFWVACDKKDAYLSNFSVFWDYYQDIEYKRGILKTTKFYDSLKNLTKSVEYSYKFDEQVEWSNDKENLTSGWAKLDRVETTIDGITNTTEFEYNPSNGLISKKIEKGDTNDRITQITYAFEQYPQLKERHWLSPGYSHSVYKNQGETLTLVNESRTDWGTDTNTDLLRPQATYQWLDNINNPNGIIDEDELICTSKFLKYDVYGNLLQEVDGNNGTTTYFYGDNSNPYKEPETDGTYNDINGGGYFSHAYLTAVQNTLGHTAATFYNNDTTIGTVTDANGISTIYLYDNFGRLKKEVKPGDTIESPTVAYDYYYAITKGLLGYVKNEKLNNYNSSPMPFSPSPLPEEPQNANLNMITTWQKITGTKTIQVRKHYDGLGKLLRTEAENTNDASIESYSQKWEKDWSKCQMSNVTTENGNLVLAKLTGGYNYLPVYAETRHGKSYEYNLSLSDSSYKMDKWWRTNLQQHHSYDNGTYIDYANNVLRIRFRCNGSKWSRKAYYGATYHVEGWKYVNRANIISPPIYCGDIVSWGKFQVEVSNGQIYWGPIPCFMPPPPPEPPPSRRFIQIYTQSSDDGINWEDWKQVTSDDIDGIQSSIKKYIRWKMEISTSNSSAETPVIKSVTINWNIKVDNDIISDIEYNKLGLKEKIFKPYIEKEGRGGYTKYIYEPNPLARISEVIYPDNSTVTTSYSNDGQNRIVSVKDENNHWTQTKFDKLGNMIEKQTDSIDGISFNNSTTYEYDIPGNLIRVVDPEGNITEYEYDTLSRLIKKTHPDTGITEYHYDNNGNLRFKRDALHIQEGLWVEYRYDILNRLTQKGLLNYSGDNPYEAQGFESKVDYLYDGKHPYAPQGDNYPVGNLTRMIDGAGTTTYYYDARDRLVRQEQFLSGANYVTRYAYDSGDNLTSITDPAGKVTNYSYNHLNQLTSLNINDIGSVTYIYTPESAVDNISFANGITTKYSYYPRGWIKTIDTQKTSNPIFQRLFTYDQSGNLTQEYSDATGTTAFANYTYD